MSVFKCKMCGGALEIQPGQTVAECEYCGTRQTLPKLDDEKRANLYDRANHFRRNNEFDKAMGIYEQILNEDKTDAESYWSLVLCRYGIEYVEDPATHRRVPTVNRAQFTSIFDDDNYKSALSYADSYQRGIYQAEAKAINEIQKGILAISQKEEPFDVFICYKETDNNGRRTPDSVLANDLYHQLKQEGFKVFFSRITLEDKLGSAYEPYIFAALNSAKVMVVLGTKPEYFSAVWVKNEWSRYLALIRQGQKKMLIPAYKDMDPYDLPEEFSHLQAQDMGKLGFMQDLIRGIKKIAQADAPKTSVGKETGMAGGHANSAPLERLLQNSATYLKLHNYNLAEDVYLTVTKEYPEDYRGWWGLIVCKTKNFADVILDQSRLNTWFGYVKQLASPENFKKLEDQYVGYTRKVSQLAAKEDINKVISIQKKHSDEIGAKKNRIRAFESKISASNARCADEIARINGRKQHKEKELSDCNRARRRKAVGLISGSVVFLVGLGLFSGGGISGILLGALIGLVGICIFVSNIDYTGSASVSFERLNKREANARTEISEAGKAKGNCIRERDRDIAVANKGIRDTENEIAILNEKIANCTRYLNLGKDKIAELWFSKECAAFGVIKPLDKQTQAYRNAAFDIDQTYNARDARQTNERTGMESFAFQPASGTVTNEAAVEAPHRITCPLCNQEFDIDDAVIATGRCFCAVCGTKIELKG